MPDVTAMLATRFVVGVARILNVPIMVSVAFTSGKRFMGGMHLMLLMHHRIRPVLFCNRGDLVTEMRPFCALLTLMLVRIRQLYALVFVGFHVQVSSFYRSVTASTTAIPCWRSCGRMWWQY